MELVKKGRDQYTQTFINDALVLLARNGGNITRTAKKLKIDPKTLRKWRDKASDYTALENTAEVHQMTIREEMLKTSIEGMVLAVNKVADPLPEEGDLSKVVLAMKALTDQAEKLGATVDNNEEEDDTEFIATFRD